MCAACADSIDDFIVSEMARTKSPAIEVGIIKNGKVIKHEVYGKANVELDVPAKKGDLYEIGSITKQFTAVATMMLVEESKISLDDSILKHLNDGSKSWEKIKVKNLLYQTSGLRDYALETGLGLTDVFSRSQFMETMGKLPLDFEPGIAWAYSNTNYALLGWIIEKASGKNYMEFVRERIFDKIGMSKTTFSDPNRIVIRRAAGYLNVSNALYRALPSTASINSDGTILSNVEDMLKWESALREKKLLKPSSYELLFTKAELSSGRWRPYGMGFNLPLPGDEPYYGHGGNSSGYSAGFACYPKAGISVIVVGNVYAFGGEPMAKQIAELIEPNLKPILPQTVKDVSPDRTEKIRSALIALGEAKADEGLLEPEVTALMKTRRATMGQSGLAPLRGLENLKFAGELVVGSDKLLNYFVETKSRNYFAKILWSKNNRVAMVSLRPDGPPKTG